MIVRSSPAALGIAFLALAAAASAAAQPGAPSAAEPGAQPAAPSAVPLPDDGVLRSWVRELEASPKGPFDGIRWFCADGTVHPARPYPCEARGGGIQHGLLGERARRLREAGFRVANVLADLDPKAFVGEAADLEGLGQILVERFLVQWKEGWILRAAGSYRGALQAEDEEAGALALVRALLADPLWHEPGRYLLLRESVRLLPVRADADTAAEVRAEAARVEALDPRFAPLRAKIHGSPDAGDGERVRRHLARHPNLPAGVGERLSRLAAALDLLFSDPLPVARLRKLAPRLGAEAEIEAALAQLSADPGPAERLVAGATLLEILRRTLPGPEEPGAALETLRASLAVERQVFAAAQTAAASPEVASRAHRLDALVELARALYGTGLLSRRQLSGVEWSRSHLAAERVPLSLYRTELAYLGRAPEWCGRSVAYALRGAIARIARLEPDADLYLPDRLRGSPLLGYSALLDELQGDANTRAGVVHELFGEASATGLRALNPGLARGILLEPDAGDSHGSLLRADGIYLLPETTSELPPVSGILTESEGSSLSHVQLLARNLGIPNVVVEASRLASLRQHLGEPIVMAVSPGGVVRIARDGPEYDAWFGAQAAAADDVRIVPDLAKLDLEARRPISLSALRADDSGRRSGPKGANLGELAHFFPDAVPPGFVIPFGAFRALLEQPIEPGGPSAFEWMKAQYGAIAGTPAELREARVASFLSRLRAWISEAPLPEGLEASVVEALRSQFGPDGRQGVFVRSDTNVEDLPGFTGAGLNRTVPNVVGEQAVLRALRDVWVSPFTERAYRWRQSLMDRPEYVFPAVVVQQAFPSEKSGVMVTADVDTGDRRWLSIAINEGVGGAVDGQAAEQLRIPRDGGRVRFLSHATALSRAVLDPAGGLRSEPTRAAEAVLDGEEARALVALAERVDRFPALRRDPEPALAADVEFAFRGGRLALLQIRPFVESKRAQRSAVLQALDAPLQRQEISWVPMNADPATPSP